MPSLRYLASVAAFASCVLSAPTGVTTQTQSPTLTDSSGISAMGIEIHKSCNITERRQLEVALKDTEEIALAARNHILNNGADDVLFKKYFGSGPAAEVIGWFDKLLYGNKAGVLLRCDDIDENCHQDGWAGHWRSSNATTETVICEMSYKVRRPLSQMCALGYEVASYKTNVFFASDLVHRFFHVPKISDEIIDHYSHGGYAECLEFAKENSTFAVRNSDSLQYFALDAYGFDVANPGVGCSGKLVNGEVTSSSTIPSTTPSPITPSPTTATTQAVTQTTDAPRECHTHADGFEHCT